ncbi:hypothetical protein GX411_01895 [Candidatus Fermentibacteria bacterium]|nr:hypothetical protein [Candidatus Fermentibacteria bacterium]
MTLLAAALASYSFADDGDERSVRLGIASSVLFPLFEGYDGCSFDAAPGVCAEAAVEIWNGLGFFADAIPFEHVLAPEFEGEYRLDLLEASVRLTRFSGGLQYRLHGMEIAPTARLSVARIDGRFIYRNLNPEGHGDVEYRYDFLDAWAPSIAIGADLENEGRYFSLLVQYTALEQEALARDSGGIEGPFDNSFFEIRFCTGMKLF